MYVATRTDIPLVRVSREGYDEATAAHLDALIGAGPLLALARRSRGRHRTVAGLAELLSELSHPHSGLVHQELDIDGAIAFVNRDGTVDGALARAIVGLQILAGMEGLARRYRPTAEYPYLSVHAVRSVCLPVVQLLKAADLHNSAAMLARLLRHYMMCDPQQRMSADGREAIAACRAVEADQARRLRASCQEAAWHLRAGIPERYPCRLCVAALFFSVGEPLRAQALASGHVPSLSVMVDLVELSMELVLVDPLLQAVWLITLGESGAAIPDEVRFMLRVGAPEFNGAFKGTDFAAKQHFGMSYSEAYAHGVLEFLGGRLDAVTDESQWWKVLTEALKLPPAWFEYPSGLARMLELFSFAAPVDTPLPSSEMISAFAGHGSVIRSDLREVASMSLGTDEWTVGRGQVGRSLAYDSAFMIEPWRRKEDVEQSIDMLENHRYASLNFWLMAIPPLLPKPRGRKRRNLVQEDMRLAEAYRWLAFAVTVQEAPLYLRVYGVPVGQRIIRFEEGDRRRMLMEYDDRRQKWYETARKVWPEYAHERTQWAASVKEMGLRLGLGWRVTRSPEDDIDIQWQDHGHSEENGGPASA